VHPVRDGSGESRTVIQLSSRLAGDGCKAHLVNVLTYIIEHERAETRLAQLAEFDAITGVPNQAQFWRLLEARIETAAAVAAPGGRGLATSRPVPLVELWRLEGTPVRLRTRLCKNL